MPRPRKLPPTITASLLFDTSFAIHPAPRRRAWMNDTQGGFAYHCLPLVMANQAGWILTSGRTVLATWTGGSTPEDLTVESPEGEDPPASSQFGHGILSWEIPYVFRTSPGYNLLARGPANWWKDGAVPLEGLVETDWSVATFTMNWKLTTPGLEVRFEPDDPICMLVPQRRGELESFEPSVGRLEDQPELQRQYRAWERARNDAIARLEDPARPQGVPTEWQRDYLRGTAPGGAHAGEHQTRLNLRDFVQRDGTPVPER
ncbi:MAG TPA: DUF6065 family protein [Gemmatimonadales bacterium]|jgi:hypothetical protein